MTADQVGALVSCQEWHSCSEGPIAVGLTGAGSATVHQIWLPPLPAALTLGDLAPSSPSALIAVIGTLTCPASSPSSPSPCHSQEPASGHLAMLGGPQTGKSTTLRTLALALADTHSPQLLAIHALDFGGGTLRTHVGLPHVGTVAGSLEPDLATRVCAELVSELERREAVFARRRIGSPERMRALHTRGELPELTSADVFLFVDDYSTIKNHHDDLPSGS